MIRRVTLVNFLSHRDTEIEFDEGLTVFIGRNGAGKSSVIDAITYALYGEHMRGENAHVVRDGSQGGKVEVEYHLGGKKYEVVRQFDNKGNLKAAVIKENGRTLVVGEKRDEESVSATMSRILGMSYERMRSSVVIQQGEVDAILRSEPKELKELFDDLLGLRAFEKAYDRMKEVLDGFRERIRMRTGRYPDEIKSVEKELEDLRNRVKEAKAMERTLAQDLEKLRDEHKKISERISELDRILELNLELKNCLDRLRERVRGEVRRLEEKVVRLEDYSKLLAKMQEVEARVRGLDELKSKRLALNEREKSVLNRIGEIEKELGALPGDESGAKTLDELKDEGRRRAERLRDDSIELGKALVSRVTLDAFKLQERIERDIESVVEVVSETYGSALASMRAELVRKKEELQKELNDVRQQLKDVEREIRELSFIDGKDVNRLYSLVQAAEQEVRNAGGENVIAALKQRLDSLKEKLTVLDRIKAPLDLDQIVLSGLDELLRDEETKRLTSQLRVGAAKLREAGFVAEMVIEREKLRQRSEVLNREIGKKEQELVDLKKRTEEDRRKIEQLENVLSVLRKVEEFYVLMKRVRDEVYHREGPVLKSLRTWIYAKVSERAREYLDMFDTVVDDVRIEEERSGRGGRVTFRCFYRGREVSWERLSGGERVVLALALRLAIGDVLGAQRLRFFILDEPTVHLDSEKRMRLRDVLMRLSRKMPQVIVITHDEEIFEGAEARVLRFEMENGATKVTELMASKV